MDLQRQDTGGKPASLFRGRWDQYIHIRQRTAAVACPTCDKLFSLVNHTISTSGVVSPSVVCPRATCTFHQMVRLIGW